MKTRIGEILPGMKFPPWSEGMELYLPDGADVIIVEEHCNDTFSVQTLDDWHNRVWDVWYVHKDNIRLKGPQ